MPVMHRSRMTSRAWCCGWSETGAHLGVPKRMVIVEDSLDSASPEELTSGNASDKGTPRESVGRKGAGPRLNDVGGQTGQDSRTAEDGSAALCFQAGGWNR